MNRCNFLLFSFFLSLSIAFGQVNTYSPYSYFGYGILHESGNTQNISMGGLGMTLMNNNNLNYVNPASYSFLETTSFDIGVKSSFIQMSQNDLTQKNFISGLSIIGLGFPVSDKIGVAVGLSPYSSVGYNLTTIDSLINHDETILESVYNYHGSGGLNKLLFGFAYNILDAANSNLSIGLNFNYLFGSISRETTIHSNPGAYFRDKSDKIMYGLNIEVGAIYSIIIEELSGYVFNWGFKLQPKSTLHSKVNTLHSTYLGPVYNSLDTIGTNIIFEELGAINKDPFPTSYALGFSLQDKDRKKWLIGLDYNGAGAYSSTELQYNFSPEVIRNYQQYHLGGFFVPNKSDIYNYFNRIEYRFGISYASGYLDVGNIVGNKSEKLQDMSITLGFGLPMSKKLSTTNLAFKYGFMGHADEPNYIRENYFSVYISMTLNEKWFNKRKIE